MCIKDKIIKIFKRILNNYQKSIFNSFALYWKVYGGIHALIKSAYLHLALLITFLLLPLWWHMEISERIVCWYTLCINIIPNILGFTLGGYAIFLAFGDKQFLKIIAETSENPNEITPFLKVNGAFIHFIIVQCCSLILAIIGNTWKLQYGLIAILGVLLLIYSLLTALAAAFALLNLGNWYNRYLNTQKNTDDNG